MSLSHQVLPGGLSDADHAEIYRLADKGWSANRIAVKISKHPATVQWFMYCAGLSAPQYRNTKPYYRNGRLVTPFTPDEDAFIEALRIQDYHLDKIAEVASKRFGGQRTSHTIRCRLIMLAARHELAS